MIKYADGNSYEGDWKDDKYHGQGKLVTKFGGTYEGSYLPSCTENLLRDLNVKYRGVERGQEEWPGENDVHQRRRLQRRLGAKLPGGKGTVHINRWKYLA